MPTRRVMTRSLLLGLALFGLAACQEPEETLKPVPLRLIGRWENESRSHAGRELLIGPDSIRYGQSGGLGETNLIEGVRERILGGGVVEYDLACVDSFAQPYTLTLVYDARKRQETMKFKNRTAVQWKKRTRA